MNTPFIEQKEYIGDIHNIQVETQDNFDGWLKIRSQNNGDLNNREAWKNSKKSWRKLSYNDSIIHYQDYKRKCYSIGIVTYNSGTRWISFTSHNEEKNKLEATQCIDYIDAELEKLI